MKNICKKSEIYSFFIKLLVKKILMSYNKDMMLIYAKKLMSKNERGKRIMNYKEKEQKKIKNQRGITLIALVITVIIIIILAVITLSFVFGEDGIINKAEQAKLQQAIASAREELEIAEANAAIDGKGHIDMDHYWDLVEEDGIINNKDTDIYDNGDGSYDIITDEDFIFNITPLPDEENTTDIVIDYEGKFEGPRITGIDTIEKTSNSVTIKVSVINATNPKFKYEYKKEGETEWTTIEGQEGDTCIITGLEQKQVYNVRVTVETSRGSAVKETNILAGELITAPIEFSMPVWKDGKASVTITTSDKEGYTLQYQVNGKEEDKWIDIESGGTVDNLSYNDNVYARLYDGTNGTDPASITIEDNNPPKVSVTAVITSNSMQVTAEAIDGESGMVANPTYTFSIKPSGQDDNSYTTPSDANNITSSSYTFTGLTQGSYDIKVTVDGDNSGNTGIGELTNQTTQTIPGGDTAVQEGKITFGTTTWNGAVASTTVNTSTNYSIEYQINGYDENKWTSIANGGTIGNLKHQDTVYARLTDGVNAGDYASTTILDNVKPSASISISPTSTTTTGSVNATVTLSDAQTGVNTTASKWVYNTSSGNIGTNESSYTGGSFSSNTQTITLTATAPGSYYLHVLTKDNAGNVAETISNRVTVNQLASSISISPSSVTLDEGDTYYLSVNFNPANTSNKSVTWSSNNTSVASVNSSGRITANNAGSATITARTTDGSGLSATCRVTVEKVPTVSDTLKSGNYVNYRDKNGTTRKCVVLYDNSSGYGVQIIAMSSLTDVTIGDKEAYSGIEKAKTSYNNAIDTLNDAANKYNNSTYSTSARCVGTNPRNPTDTAGMYSDSNSWFVEQNAYKNGDTNYTTDYNKMNSLGILNISDSYFLASRYVLTQDQDNTFRMRYINSSGALTHTTIVVSGSWRQCFALTAGVRPVFTLKSTIKVTGGSGTSSSPYTLGT